MSRKTTRNGTDRSDASERPDWYVPIAPVEGDDRTVQELLRDLQVVCEPHELSDELRADLTKYLDQFGTPRSTA